MSQFPQVNVIDTATPAGAAASGQIASNLNQGADRKLRAGEIRLNAMMEQHRIKTQAELERLKLDQEAELEKGRIASTESEHAKYQDFLSSENEKERAAREVEQKAVFARQDKLLRDQQELDLAREQAELGVFHGTLDVSKKAEADLASIEQRRKDLAEEQLALNIVAQTSDKNNGIMLEKLKETVTQQKQAEDEARTTAGHSMFAAISDALGKAAASQPGFRGRMERNKFGDDNRLGGGVLEMATSAVVSAAQVIGEQTGAVTPHVEKSAQTDPQTLVESALASLAKNDFDGGLSASGLSTEGMTGLLMSMSNAVFQAMRNPSPEADAAAKQLIAQAKQHIPAATLDGYLSTFSTLRTDPDMKEAIDKAGKGANSKEWKAANEEAFRGAAKFYGTFKRLTGNETDGTGAYINREPIDYDRAFAIAGGSVAVMAADPAKAASQLMRVFNAPPKVIENLLAQAKTLAKGTDTKEHIEATIVELRKAQAALEGEYDTIKRGRDVGLMESTAAGLQESIKTRTRLLQRR